jgi:hypothetical protein
MTGSDAHGPARVPDPGKRRSGADFGPDTDKLDIDAALAEAVTALIAGELAPEKAAALNEQIGRDPALARYHRRMRDTWQAFDAVSHLPVSDSVERDLLAAVQRAADERATTDGDAPPPTRGGTEPPAGGGTMRHIVGWTMQAAAVVAFVLVIGLLSGGREPADTAADRQFDGRAAGTAREPARAETAPAPDAEVADMGPAAPAELHELSAGEAHWRARSETLMGARDGAAGFAGGLGGGGRSSRSDAGEDDDEFAPPEAPGMDAVPDPAATAEPDAEAARPMADEPVVPDPAEGARQPEPQPDRGFGAGTDSDDASADGDPLGPADAADDDSADAGDRRNGGPTTGRGPTPGNTTGDSAAASGNRPQRRAAWPTIEALIAEQADEPGRLGVRGPHDARWNHQGRDTATLLLPVSPADLPDADRPAVVLAGADTTALLRLDEATALHIRFTGRPAKLAISAVATPADADRGATIVLTPFVGAGGAESADAGVIDLIIERPDRDPAPSPRDIAVAAPAFTADLNGARARLIVRDDATATLRVLRGAVTLQPQLPESPQLTQTGADLRVGGGSVAQRRADGRWRVSAALNPAWSADWFRPVFETPPPAVERVGLRERRRAVDALPKSAAAEARDEDKPPARVVERERREEQDAVPAPQRSATSADSGALPPRLPARAVARESGEPLPTQLFAVAVQLRPIWARTTLNLRVGNPTDADLAADFTLPLPPDSVIIAASLTLTDGPNGRSGTFVAAMLDPRPDGEPNARSAADPAHADGSGRLTMRPGGARLNGVRVPAGGTAELGVTIVVLRPDAPGEPRRRLLIPLAEPTTVPFGEFRLDLAADTAGTQLWSPSHALRDDGSARAVNYRPGRDLVIMQSGGPADAVVTVTTAAAPGGDDGQIALLTARLPVVGPMAARADDSADLIVVRGDDMGLQLQPARIGERHVLLSARFSRPGSAEVSLPRLSPRSFEIRLPAPGETADPQELSALWRYLDSGLLSLAVFARLALHS